MKAFARSALLALLMLAGFAAVNSLFQSRVLEPMLGADAAALLATTALAGAVLASALLLAGMRRS